MWNHKFQMWCTEGTLLKYCVKCKMLKENNFRVFFKIQLTSLSHTVLASHSLREWLFAQSEIQLNHFQKIQCLEKELGHAVWKAFSERGKMAFKNA